MNTLPSIVNLADSPDIIRVKDDYQIEFPNSDIFFVRTPVLHTRAAAKMEPDNAIAIIDTLFEFKHYHRDRGKFWTSRPGVDFLFVVPKSSIFVDLRRHKESPYFAKGIKYPASYSYVPVTINGYPFTFSVSGGSLNGCWTDFTGVVVSLLVGYNKKAINRLNEVALSPQACTDRGITLPARVNDQSNFCRLSWQEAVAKIAMVELLGREGPMKLWLAHGCTYSGRQGPFHVLRRCINARRNRIQKYVCSDDGWNFTVKFSQVDWVKTAQENEVPVPEPRSILNLPQEQSH